MTRTFAALETRLDELEERLPALPAASLRLQRAITSEAMSLSARLADTWQDSARTVGRATRTAFKTVTGTARWAGERTLETATTAARTVTGQASAQAQRTRATLEAESNDVLRAVKDTARAAHETTVEAVEAVEKVVADDATPTGETYEELTKPELYRRAKELDIDGRSQMSKDELIVAVRAAG